LRPPVKDINSNLVDLHFTHKAQAAVK
jgi:hypothetical protein